MSTAIFNPYDPGNSEDDLHAHAGQVAELIGLPFDADPGEGIIMQKIRFADGFEVEAFADELTDPEENA